MIRAGVLSRRRRGSVGLVAVILLVPVVMLYAASMNNGQASSDRQRTQDAADAVVQLHATWSARNLNIIAMNNVEAAQLMTVAIGSEALDGALWELRLRAYLALGHIGIHSLKCFGFRLWPLVAACLAEHAYKSRKAFHAVSYVGKTYSRFDPKHGIRTAERGLRAIDAMNKEIAARFSAAMGEMAEDYRRSLTAETVHFADPCQGQGRGCRRTNSSDGMSLPLRAGGSGAMANLCAGMTLGTLGSRTTFAEKGFPVGQGPIRYGGSASNPNVKDHINEITDIGRELQNFYDYHRKLELSRPGGFDKFPQYLNFLTAQKEKGPNAFTLRFDAKLAAICAGGVGGSALAGFALKAPIPEMWQPIGVTPVVPGPRRPEAMDPAFHVLAYAQKPSNRRVATARFRAAAGTDQFAYGQAGVWTPDGADLMSQNWRGDLMPATRIDRAGEAATKLSQQAPAAFRPLSDVLRRVGSSSGVERINAH